MESILIWEPDFDSFEFDMMSDLVYGFHEPKQTYDQLDSADEIRQLQNMSERPLLWLNEQLERYCCTYVGEQISRKVEHSLIERIIFSIASKLEFKLRKWVR